MALSDDFLLDLRQRTDIESVVSSYVTLKRKGRLLGGLCPFHNEKTPSFYVYPETQSYYCFGCGNGGDVVTFIKNIENLDYIDAVKFLCERSGIAFPEDGFDNGLSKKRTRIYEANREAAKYFHSVLMSEKGGIAQEYFIKRQLSKETVKSFGLGFAPDEWTGLYNHMKKKGFSDIELYEANLIRKTQKGNYIDAFRNRVMFPIIDLRGNVIAFGGRVMDDSKPKYLNTNDTLVYKKGKELFALNFAKKVSQQSLILCEGYMDVIALHQAGFKNAIAGLGTALTEEQAQLLSRYTSEVLICYDSDEAGQKAAKKALGIFARTTLRVKVINMQGGKDPDEIIKKYGPERFRALIDNAANNIEYRILRERDKFDVETPDGKAEFLKAAAKILAEVNSAIEVDIYAAKLSSELSVSKEAMLRQIDSSKRAIAKIRQTERNREIQKSIDDPNALINKVNKERSANLHISKAEETLIATVMNNPEYYRTIKEKIKPEDFVTEFNRNVYTVISARLDEGKPTDLSFLASSFTDDEISVVARIQTLTQLISNTIDECDDCINIIKSEKDRNKHIKPAEMSEQDFLNIFKSKSANSNT